MLHNRNLPKLSSKPPLKTIRIGSINWFEDSSEFSCALSSEIGSRTLRIFSGSVADTIVPNFPIFP